MRQRPDRTRARASRIAPGVDVAIRGGSGLGDALYVQAIARHLVLTRKQRVEVCANYPEVFFPLRESVVVSPHRRDNIHRLAHYSTRRYIPGTDQFTDVCINAGLASESVELRLDWRTGILPDDIATAMAVQHRPLIAVQLPRQPMARKDNIGSELLPDCAALQRAVELLRDRAWLVQVGSGKPLYRLSGFHFDYANRTSVSQLLDITSAANGFLGYCSFLVPLAESFSRPGLFIWSRRGLKSSTRFVRHIVPEKIFHRPSSRAVFDDCRAEELERATDALLDATGSQWPVQGPVGGDCRQRAGLTG